MFSLQRHGSRILSCVSKCRGSHPRATPRHIMRQCRAFELMQEPANALSLPTWAIHVSSVIEWGVAMNLFVTYSEVTGNKRWKAFAWGMLPALGSAMCACTWHFFYNSPSLEFLVALQAALTVIGNCTLGMAAYHVYQGALEERKSDL
jgi:hypothetical protein